MSPRGSAAANAALTSVATAATMVAGGAFALLVAMRFGTSPATDGFFAAYAVYTVVVLVAQSMRTTIIGRLVAVRGGFAAFDALLVAALLLAGLAGVLFALLAGPLTDLLTSGGTAGSMARYSLLVLWPAACLQLLAGLGASQLAVFGDFARPALAYGGGSVTSIVAFVILAGPLGTAALPLAVLLGSFVTSVPLLASVWRAGWRPRRITDAARESLRSARAIALGAGALVVAQVLYLVTLAAAARVGLGAQTVYSYGYFAHGLVLAVVASSVSIVLAVPVAQTWDRAPGSLTVHVRAVLRLGMLILAPVAGAAALVGDDVAQMALPRFSAGEVDAIISVFLALLPALVFAQALAVPIVAVYVLDRHALAAVVGVPVLAFHAVVSFLIGSDAPLWHLSVVASVSSLLFSTAMAAIVYGRATPGFLAAAGAEIAVVAVPAGACYLIAWLVLGEVGSLAVLIAGTLAFAAVVAVLLPEHRSVVRRLTAALTHRADSARS